MKSVCQYYPEAIPKLVMLYEGGVARPIVGRFEFWRRTKRLGSRELGGTRKEWRPIAIRKRFV